MAKSLVAESIIDHARSVAKRHDCEEISHLHLIAAARRWREELFDEKFPGIWPSLSSHLEAMRGTSITPPRLPDKVDRELDRVSTMDDLWKYIDGLIRASDLKPTAGKSTRKPPSGRTPRVKPKRSPKAKPKSRSKPPEKPPAENFPFGITTSLVERLASFLDSSVDETLRIVVADAWWISRRVIGAEIPTVLDEIAAELGIGSQQIEYQSEFSDLVRRIKRTTKSGASRLASQLAFAYVDHADWSAAVDDNYSEDEGKRVDEIKELLLAQLDHEVDSEVEATLTFESKFGNLIGMQEVKRQICTFVDTMVLNARRAKRGKKVEPQRLHMVFLGNPGTGKTTVARLYGSLLNDLGLMASAKFSECDASTFSVGIHLGEAEKAMNQIVEDSLDGILFIDEAYSLNDPYNMDNKQGHGLRATNVLVKRMEDHRDRLCVILAGYTEPTMKYVRANPGMPSRIGCYITFPDYSPDEILQLVSRIAERKGVILGEGTRELISAHVERERESRSFGNARTVEKIIESAQRKCATRCASLGPLATERALQTVLLEDLDELPAVDTQPERQDPRYLRNLCTWLTSIEQRVGQRIVPVPIWEIPECRRCVGAEGARNSSLVKYLVMPTLKRHVEDGRVVDVLNETSPLSDTSRCATEAHARINHRQGDEVDLASWIKFL